MGEPKSVCSQPVSPILSFSPTIIVKTEGESSCTHIRKKALILIKKEPFWYSFIQSFIQSFTWMFHVCLCIMVVPDACEGQMRVLDSSGPGIYIQLWTIMWVLGIKSRPSGKADSILNH